MAQKINKKIKKIEIPVIKSLSISHVEKAFESGCTVRQAAALLDVSIDSIDSISRQEYGMSGSELRDYICDRGIAKYKMLIHSRLINGDIDYHRVYGKQYLEQVCARDDIADDTGAIIQYEAHLPSNGRD